MNALRELLQRFWIVKEQDKDLFYEIKGSIDQHKEFIQTQLGYQLYINEKLIKLEKIPGKALPCMGIDSFLDKMDYMFLCVLLAFLDDKAEGQAFLLKELTDFLSAYFESNEATVKPDWTLFLHRKALVRVLLYAQEVCLVKVKEGRSDGYAEDAASEILYQSTGNVRFYSVHFTQDISAYESAEDFAASYSRGTDSQRGTARINRTYRKLVLGPAMYWENDDPLDADYIYLKNQRQWVEQYLQEHLDATLSIHSNGAYMSYTGEDVVAITFPDMKGISDIVLLLCGLIRQKQNEGLLRCDAADKIHMPMKTFAALLRECEQMTSDGWTATHREMGFDRLLKEIIQHMSAWMLIQKDEEGVCVLPLAGRFAGRYPADFGKADTTELENDVEQISLTEGGSADG